MNPDPSLTRDCSSMYRFQFASIALLCALYLPYTFHSTIWSLYVQPINGEEHRTNFTSNRSDCCPCEEFRRAQQDLFHSCQLWYERIQGIERRKTNLLDEWHLINTEKTRFHLLIGSLSFLIAELIGLFIIAMLADRYGRKLMLLVCLYIPVLFGSLAAFTTTYLLFLILRWPVGFFNRGLLVVVYLLVIESCEYKSRAQIACLLLASLPIFGIFVGISYFFLPDWRHLQLFGSLISTLALCYPWLIPESRRWYVNSHRVSRVNKLFQMCSTLPISGLTVNGLSTADRTHPPTIYDKPIVAQDSMPMPIGSISSLIRHSQLRTMSFCLVTIWFLVSFCYRSTIFPTLVTHPMINHVVMNAIEFFSFVVALVIAPRMGRRVPLAVLILIAGLSSVSLAIAYLGTGYVWLETALSITVRFCLRICYCLLIVFTAELYPTSIRATGLALGLNSETMARILVELVLYFVVNRTLLLFLSGGLLCLTCCLVMPLAETLLYDLPDSLSDFHSMREANKGDEEKNNRLATHSHYHMIDANTVACPRSNPSTTDFNDLLSLNPRSTEEQTQPCYFASVQDTIETSPIDHQHINNRLMISLRAAQHQFNENTKL